MTSPLNLTCTRTPAGLIVMRCFGYFFHPGPVLVLMGFSLLPGCLPGSHYAPLGMGEERECAMPGTSAHPSAKKPYATCNFASRLSKNCASSVEPRSAVVEDLPPAIT